MDICIFTSRSIHLPIFQQDLRYVQIEFASMLMQEKPHAELKVNNQSYLPFQVSRCPQQFARFAQKKNIIA